MKTPEQIFNSHASKIMKQFDMDNFKRDYPSLWKTIEETLKAMQSDHEKELVGFAEYYDSLSPIEKCTVHSPNGSGTGLYLKPTKELLTQFRKG